MFFLLLFILNLLVFWPTLSVGFLSDDFDFLYHTRHQDPLLRHFGTNYLGGTSGGSYAPMLNVYFTGLFSVFGLNAVPYHMANILIHSLNAFLVFLLGRAILRRSWVAFGAALLFALLPSKSETVAWVAGIPHLLATSWFLLGLFLYTYFVQTKIQRWYWLSLGAIALSLLTKETAMVFLPLFVLFDLFYREKSGDWKSELFRLGKHTVPLAFVLIGYFLIRWIATDTFFGYYGQAKLSLDYTHLFEQGFRLVVGTVVSEPWREFVVSWLLGHRLLVTLGFGAGISALILSLPRWRKALLFLSFSYILTLVPFLQLSFHPLTNEGERYTYTISVFFALLCVVILRALSERFCFGHVGMAAILLFWILTGMPTLVEKNRIWQQAGDIAQSILKDAEMLLPHDGRTIVVVGLPDTLGGAQIFRNAFFEAVALVSDSQRLPGVRIPLYAFLTPAEHHDIRVYDVRPFEYRLESMNGARAFTGFPEWIDGTGRYALESFELNGHTGTAIEIRLEHTETAGAGQLSEDPVLVVYTSEGLKRAFSR